MRQLAADNGTACRPGERVQITSLRFTGREIVFEINGGPLARKKWWQGIEVGSAGTVAPLDRSGSNPDDIYNHAHGSYVTLAFKDYVPELTAAQVKEMLAPVLDFKAVTAAEAYEKSLPPKLQQAVKEHRALVGMDREMVTYAKGRPPRRIRERDGATEYEEWIYGQPPAEVEFIRFVGETVIRIETMKVDGEKIVRTEPEVDLGSEISSMAGKTSPQPAAGNSAPSLLRPGRNSSAQSRVRHAAASAGRCRGNRRKSREFPTRIRRHRRLGPHRPFHIQTPELPTAGANAADTLEPADTKVLCQPLNYEGENCARPSESDRW